jgi:hypothetical protein
MENDRQDRRNPQLNLDNDGSTIYQFRIEGYLGSHWKNWFGEVDISLQKNGFTLLTAPVVDQAALHGLLKKIRNAGMTLDSVLRVKSV